MTKSWQISRRTVLRGMGTAMALPLLDAMAPAGHGRRAQGRAHADGFRLRAQRQAHARLDARGRWCRLRAALHHGTAGRRQRPNCWCSPAWPRIMLGRTATGPATMPELWRRFSPGRSRARPTAPTSRWACRSTRWPPARSASRTKFPSLELGCDRGAQAGNCDSGYSCSYSTNISWRSDTDAAGQGNRSASWPSNGYSPAAPMASSVRSVNGIVRACSTLFSKTPAT